MGTSTNGQISYGIKFDDGFEFPWDSLEYEGDIENWWTHGVLGFRYSFELYTPEGNYIGGERPPQEKLDQYYAERREFEAKNPKLPVELDNYCSGDFPMYILSVKGVGTSARRGYPTAFNPSELVVTDEQVNELLGFCQAHGIELDGEPAWYLSSYWG